MGFQTEIGNPSWAVAGDFASTFPPVSMLNDNALYAGAAGVTIGNFAWVTTGNVVNSKWSATTDRIGFIPRQMQGLITTFGAEASMVIPAGLPVAPPLVRCENWATFAAGATIGQNVYAAYGTGALVSGESAPTNTFTANTTNASATITVTAVNTGMVIALGQPVSGTNIPANAYISAFGTGTGGAGTYTISAAATGTATGTTVTATTAVLTKFAVASTAAAGELAKITPWEL
jgi:hypothetical protein